jgi:hypothetical protein
MKKNIIILLVLVAFMGTSCSNFLNVNEVNPNTASSVAPKLVMPAALNAVAYTMNNPRRFEFVYLWHGLWSISAGYTQPQSLVQYRLYNSSYQTAFNELYTTANNFDVIENSTDSKDVLYIAMAKIMKAFIFQNLVDCYGNVPYSEAFKTASGNLKPKYDDQKVIYADLINKLNAAITLIQNAPADVNQPGTKNDIIYGGNMAKWLKFANTLKLRILIHQAAYLDKATISAALATTSSIGYIGAGESALNNPGYLTSATKMNPFYEIFYNAAGTTQADAVSYYFAGKNVIDYMKTTVDPRIGKFYQPYSGTSFAGNVMGYDPKDLLTSNKTSKLGFSTTDANTMIGSPSKSAPILTDFESYFLQAEAIQRGILTGDLTGTYNAAVTQSFIYMGLTSFDASQFIAGHGGLTTTLENQLEQIITQKWVALNGVAPVEIWDDFRRTGFPSIITFSPDPNKDGPGYPPLRLPYPQTELNVNSDNVLAVGTISTFTSKIFWDTRTH